MLKSRNEKARNIDHMPILDIPSNALGLGIRVMVCLGMGDVCFYGNSGACCMHAIYGDSAWRYTIIIKIGLILLPAQLLPQHIFE